MSLLINYNFNIDSEINNSDGKKIINSAPDYNKPEYYATNYGGVIGKNGINDYPNAILLNSSAKQYVQIPQINITNNGLTFAFWFQSNNNYTWARIFDIGNRTGNDDIISYINNGYIGFSVYNGGNKYAIDNVIPNMNNNKWNHIAWILSPTNGWKIYLNGIFTISYTDGYYPSAGFRNNNYIGKSNLDTDPYFNGGILDFRIYNGILTDADISTIYNKYNNNDTPIVFNDLYNEIYCNINISPYRNGFKTFTGKSFNDDISILKTLTTTSDTQCLDNCYSNPNCTSYKYTTTLKENNCTLYRGFPSHTVDASNINSGYSITKFGYPFTSLNSAQKSRIKNYCIKKYLGNTYPSTKDRLDDPDFININDNGDKTVLDIDAQNLYNKYKSVGINTMGIINNSTFTPSNPTSSSDSIYSPTTDSIIDNYGNTYKRYSDTLIRLKNENNSDVPTKDSINYINNVVSPKNNDFQKEYLNSIDTKKSEILENFENNLNYNKFFLLLIIFLFIFFIVSILYKK
jgi:hypothetical protein